MMRKVLKPTKRITRQQVSPGKVFFEGCVTVLTVIMTAVLLSGCTVASVPADTAPPGVEESNRISLKFTYWGSLNEKNAIETACRKFSEKYRQISIDPVQIPDLDYNSKMMLMSVSNDLPDTGYMTGDLGEAWANEGKFVNLFDLLRKDGEIKKEDFLDYIWFRLNPDYAWGISTAGECFGLFYNRELLQRSGITPLPTRAETAMGWKEFIGLAQRLTLDRNGKNALDPGFDCENVRQYGVMFETWDEPINNFIFSNGGEWLSKDGKSFLLNSPESAEAIQKLADLINVYHVAPSPVTAKSMPSMSIALQTGLTAMAIGGQWMNLDLGNAKVDYDIGVLPKLKRSITVGLSGATVLFASSSHPEEAWRLFKWMSNPESAIELYSGGLWMPTLKKWYTDPRLVSKWVDANPASHPAGFREAMMEQLLKNGVPQPLYYMRNTSAIVPKVTAGLDPVWMGRKTAADALAEIEKTVQAEIRGRYDATN